MDIEKKFEVIRKELKALTDEAMKSDSGFLLITSVDGEVYSSTAASKSMVFNMLGHWLEGLCYMTAKKKGTAEERIKAVHNFVEQAAQVLAEAAAETVAREDFLE